MATIFCGVSSILSVKFEISIPWKKDSLGMRTLKPGDSTRETGRLDSTAAILGIVATKGVTG
jgi:hypothetical protein